MKFSVTLSSVKFGLIAALLVLFSTLNPTQAANYEEIDWVALMPEDDLSALLNRPEFLNDIADGSAADSVDDFASKQLEDEQAQRYQQALVSTRVIEAFDGKAIRIPGFIVPLEQNDEQKATAFFVVPYFGACLHMPPPPPNQILYVEYKEGIAVENLYDPYWFEGTVKIDNHESALGTSAYSLVLEDEQAQRYQQALVSTRVIEAFDGKAIRIPGFIVPLEQNDEQKATAFFVVPYFGACLHMPPPPPNQILYVEYKEGIAVENLYDPYWFEGTVKIDNHESALGTSAYSLVLDSFALYEE